MHRISTLFAAVFTFVALGGSMSAAAAKIADTATKEATSAGLHHAAKVTIGQDASGADGSLELIDIITFPAREHLLVEIPANAKVVGLGGAVEEGRTTHGDLVRLRLRPEGPGRAEGPEGPAGSKRGPGRVTLQLVERFVAPPIQAAKEHQRSFQETPGIINREGAYLSPSSAWLPRVVDETGRPMLFTSEVRFERVPADWRALTEGTPDQDFEVDVGRFSKPVTIRQTTPVEGLHLVAGPFTQVKKKLQGTDVVVWLRRGKDGKAAKDQDALADRYLEVTGQYLQLFGELIAPYPYERFTLVENFWETGYGMPTFTLLGPQVVRFPFILHTSWPHELLHNWWGNGVFPEGGNWSEGLTAYLADHENAERQGRGADHRRDTIQRYLDFVATNPADDFPLTDFTSRFSAASEAVGYGKTLMVFHMLRRQVGDDVFVDGLRRFWKSHRFQRASFDDLAAAFSAAAGADLTPFFRAWTTQEGIPSLRVVEVKETMKGPGTHGPRRFASVVVEQRTGRTDTHFPMTVPVVFSTVDGRTVSTVVKMTGRTGSAQVNLPAELARVDVDPFYDVFRTLSPDEVPPTMSRALGAQKHLFVLPTFGSKDELKNWRSFAEAMCPAAKGDTKDFKARCTIVDDKSVGTLPKDAAVWILGYGSNLRAGPYVLSKPYEVRFDDRGFFGPGGWERVMAADDRRAVYDKERVDPSKTGLAVVVEHPRNRNLAMAFVGSPSATMIPLLQRKLPHYGKYGAVGFAGDDAENMLKLQWSSSTSPMTRLIRADPGFALKAPPPLRPLPPPFDGVAMLDTVEALSNTKDFPRGRGDDVGINKALDVIEARLKAAGIATTKRQCTDLNADDAKKTGLKEVCNLVASLPGADPTLPRVVLGAHYDHLPAKGRTIYPGADDNGSGVAVVVELAVAFRRQSQARTLDLVFFGGEEAGLLGSKAWVAAQPAGSVMAMVNLDSVGRLLAESKEGMLVLDGNSAKEWVHIVRGVGFTTGVKATLATQGGGSSDQKAFNDVGIPAIQLFSGPHGDYHRASDTAEKVSSSSLVQAAVLAREIVVYLRDRPEPLSALGASTSTSTSTATTTAGPRRASLGSVPDMAFAGPGVRFADVVADSPAEEAGLRAGDILVRVDASAIADLRAYSEVLKAHAPGDVVTVVVLRGGKEVKVPVTLAAR